MQHIGVKSVNSKFETIQGTDINFANILKGLLELGDFDSKFPTTSGIDPYGDTLFNSLQRNKLAEELVGIKEALGDEFAADIEDISKFLDGLDPHDFIVFLGD